MVSWIEHSHFFELEQPQCSEAWTQARVFRLTGHKWSSAINTKTIPDIATPLYLPDWDRDVGGKREAEALNAYRKKYPGGRAISLCIPNPQSYTWVPKEKRYLLLHLGGSPDWIHSNVCVELKRPDHPRPFLPRKHWGQLMANSGLIGTSGCRYYCYHPEEIFVRDLRLDQKWYQETVLTLLDLLEPVVQQIREPFLVPPSLESWYRSYR